MITILPAYLTNGENVSHSFMISMMRMIGYAFTDGEAHILDPMRMRASAGGIAQGRNDLTRQFLQGSTDYLWMIDTDMGFDPDTALRLARSASPEEAPVVGALCFSARHEEPDPMGGYRVIAMPTIFGWDAKGFKAVTRYPIDTVVKVAGTGAACLLLHRVALEKVRAEYGEDWWTPVRYPSGQMLGEDLSLCYRLGELGIPVHVDTSVKTTHAKMIWISEEDWMRQEGRHVC